MVPLLPRPLAESLVGRRPYLPPVALADWLGVVPFLGLAAACSLSSARLAGGSLLPHWVSAETARPLWS